MSSRIVLAVVSLVAVGAAATAGGARAQEPDPVARGKAVFQHRCAPCHGAGKGDDGAPMLPGSFALQLKYRGQRPAFLEQRTDLTAPVIKTFVRNGVASMPPFRKTEVTDQDIEAVAAYIASKPATLTPR